MQYFIDNTFIANRGPNVVYANHLVGNAITPTGLNFNMNEVTTGTGGAVLRIMWPETSIFLDNSAFNDNTMAAGDAAVYMMSNATSSVGLFYGGFFHWGFLGAGGRGPGDA